MCVCVCSVVLIIFSWSYPCCESDTGFEWVEIAVIKLPGIRLCTCAPLWTFYITCFCFCASHADTFLFKFMLPRFVSPDLVAPPLSSEQQVTLLHQECARSVQVPVPPSPDHLTGTHTQLLPFCLTAVLSLEQLAHPSVFTNAEAEEVPERCSHTGAGASHTNSVVPIPGHTILHTNCLLEGVW